MAATFPAFSAAKAREPLKPREMSFDAPLGSREIEVEVECTGVCHSDLCMLNNEWGMSSYPLTPGHEIIGRIVAVGSEVAKENDGLVLESFDVGQRVGVGWDCGYCERLTCRACTTGDHNLCRGCRPTVISPHGGFARRIRASATAAAIIPEGLASTDAAPLLCAGTTVYNPLVQFGVRPNAKVGVVGCGGLGHLALQFYAAWGCDVVAFTSTPAKAPELRKLGARSICVLPRDGAADDDAALGDAVSLFELEAALDFILVTTSACSLPWSGLLDCVAPKGRLHIVGAITEPVPVEVVQLQQGQRSLSSSSVGPPGVIREMLAFAARHGIKPVTEVASFTEGEGKVNEVLQRLAKGDVRYRAVLKWE